MTGETPFRVGGVSAGGSRCAEPEDTPPWRTEFPSSARAETEFRHEGGEIAKPRRWGIALVVRFLVRVFVCGEDGGEGIGGGEDFFRQIEKTLEGAAMFRGLAGGFGLGGAGAGEVFVPALHVVVEGVVVAVPAGGGALGFVEPGDEIEAVHGGEAGCGLGGVLLHAGEDGVPDDEIDGRVGLFALGAVARVAPQRLFQDAGEHGAVAQHRADFEMGHGIAHLFGLQTEDFCAARRTEQRRFDVDGVEHSHATNVGERAGEDKATAVGGSTRGRKRWESRRDFPVPRRMRLWEEPATFLAFTRAAWNLCG